jgi:nitrous oxidase accessory protein
VRGNRISSKPLALGVRGDGLRLWYSNDNRIEDNEVTDSRDMVAWYSNAMSSATTSAGAAATRSTSCSPTTTWSGNRFYDNAVGVYLMYTEGVHVCATT